MVSFTIKFGVKQSHPRAVSNPPLSYPRIHDKTSGTLRDALREQESAAFVTGDDGEVHFARHVVRVLSIGVDLVEMAKV